MTKNLCTALLVSTTALALPAWAAGPGDNPGAHRHGHAELQVAISGNQVDLLFLSPAHNVFGFEHRARTESERARVQAATNWLETNPLVNTPSGDCTIQDVTIAHQAGAATDGHDEDHHHDHDHDHHDDHDGDHGHAGGHSELEAAQTLTCPSLADASSLATSLNDQFPELDSLAVAWIFNGQQGAARLGQGENEFELGGR